MRVSFEGNIGCGKTAVLEALRGRGVDGIALEPVDTAWKEWIEPYYTDPKRNACLFQIRVFLTFFEAAKTAHRIFERSPLAAFNMFTRTEVQNGTMNLREVELVHDVCMAIGWEPDCMVYLRCPPAICMERIKTRRRDGEAQIDMDYLESLHIAAEEMFASFDGPKTCIDGTATADVVLEEATRFLAANGFI